MKAALDGALVYICSAPAWLAAIVRWRSRIEIAGVLDLKYGGITGPAGAAGHHVS